MSSVELFYSFNRTFKCLPKASSRQSVLSLYSASSASLVFVALRLMHLMIRLYSESGSYLKRSFSFRYSSMVADVSMSSMSGDDLKYRSNGDWLAWELLLQ